MKDTDSKTNNDADSASSRTTCSPFMVSLQKVLDAEPRHHGSNQTKASSLNRLLSGLDALLENQEEDRGRYPTLQQLRRELHEALSEQNPDVPLAVGNDHASYVDSRGSFSENVQGHAPASEGAASQQGEGGSDPEKFDSEREAGCCAPSCSLIEFREYMSACESCAEQGRGSFPVPFLNLLFLRKESLERRDQSKPVWYYRVRKDIYATTAFPVLFCLYKTLKEIFPDSFLFRLNPERIQYRDDLPRVISLETLEILHHQILVLDSSCLIEGDTPLCQVVREAWLHTQTPIPHMRLALAGDDFRADPEVRDGLTWLWGVNPFSKANVEVISHLPEGEASTVD